MRRTPTRRMLERLLDQRNEHPERLGEIDGRIRRTFEERHAILVLDMCGFSRLTVRHGIVHFLAMIRRLHRTVAPIIRAEGGRVVKTEADNVFAIFPDVRAAVAASRAIGAALARANTVLPADWDLHVGIGIGHGELLLIGRDDLYGAEVNFASKLGEDVAGAGEILLTEAAARRLPPAARGRLGRGRRVRLGGQVLRYYSLPAAR